AKEGAHFLVILFIRVIRGQKMLNRTVDAELSGVIPQEAGEQERKQKGEFWPLNNQMIQPLHNLFLPAFVVVEESIALSCAYISARERREEKRVKISGLFAKGKGQN